MAAAIKMDELLVLWLGSDTVYENARKLLESYPSKRVSPSSSSSPSPSSLSSLTADPARETATAGPSSHNHNHNHNHNAGGGNDIDQGNDRSNSSGKFDMNQDGKANDTKTQNKDKGTTTHGVVPPFYTPGVHRKRHRWASTETFWKWLPEAPKDGHEVTATPTSASTATATATDGVTGTTCARDQVFSIMNDLQITSFTLEHFPRVTKEVFKFPSFFKGPLFKRICAKWTARKGNGADGVANEDESPSSTSTITVEMLEWFWQNEIEPYDDAERFFHLMKQPDSDCIVKDDFLPYIKELLSDHPVSQSIDHAVRQFLVGCGRLLTCPCHQ